MNELTITIKTTPQKIIFIKDDFRLELKQSFVRASYSHAMEIFTELFDKYQFYKTSKEAH